MQRGNEECMQRSGVSCVCGGGGAVVIQYIKGVRISNLILTGYFGELCIVDCSPFPDLHGILGDTESLGVEQGSCGPHCVQDMCSGANCRLAAMCFVFGPGI